MTSYKFVVPLVVLFLVNESLGRPGLGDLLDPVGLLHKNIAGSHAESESQSFGSSFNLGPIGISGTASSSKSAASANGGGLAGGLAGASSGASSHAQAQSQGGAGLSGANAASGAHSGAQAILPFGQ